MQRKTNQTTNNLDDWNLFRCFIPFASRCHPCHMPSIKFLAVFFTALCSRATTTDTDDVFSLLHFAAEIHERSSMKKKRNIYTHAHTQTIDLAILNERKQNRLHTFPSKSKQIYHGKWKFYQ